MALKQNSIENKLCLYFIFHHKIAFRDFFIPQALGKIYYTYYYQIPPALCDELVWAGARGTGKSFDLEFSLLQTPFLNPGTESLVAAYRRTHVKDRLEKVISYLSNVAYLRSFLHGDCSTSLREAVTRSPVYCIKFKNKHEMSGLSTGDDPQAVNLQGRHPCVHPWQRIILSDGSKLSIERLVRKIKKGERIFVKSYNIHNNTIVDSEVIDGWASPILDKQIFRIILEDNTHVLLTGEHKVYTYSYENFKLKLVNDLIVGKDYLVSDEPELTEAQRSLVIGSILGDAHISISPWNDGRINRKSNKELNVADASHRVTFSHSATHGDYIQFKYDVLKNFVSQKKIRIRKQVPMAHGHYQARFSTRCLSTFDAIASLCTENINTRKNHRKKKKIITQEFLNEVDEKALAIWYMDDGSRTLGKSGVIYSLYLHTQGFSLPEHRLLKQFFKKHFNIDVSICCNSRFAKTYYHLRFNRKNALKFIDLIVEYMHPIFLYKIVNIETDVSRIGKKINEFFSGEIKLHKKLIKQVVIDQSTNVIKKVYDLEVKDTNNFFVSHTLVSNCHRFIEEAQFITNEAWQKYQNTQAQGGSVDRYYGVSHGTLDSPFYEMTHRLRKFKNKVFRVHRALEPNWTQETKRDKLATLRGPSSNEWLQQIEAQDGEPSFGVWNEADIKKNIDFSEQPDFPGSYAHEMKIVSVLAKEYTNDLNPSQVLYGLPQLPSDDCEVILGIDAGYSQPTVILPFFFYQNKWNLRCKILLLDRMISNDQTELVDYVASFYNAYLGIDCSSADGRDIAQSLCNPKNEEYNNKQYDKRIFYIDFKEAVLTGYKRIRENNNTVSVIEIKENMKNKSTTILREKFYNEAFDIYYDEDLLPEFISETQINSGGRKLINTPDHVHIPEAFRCFAGAWWKLKVVIEKPPLDEEESDDAEQLDFVTYEKNDMRLFQTKPDKSE